LSPRRPLTRHNLRMAETDGLTGLLNHRESQERLRQEVEGAAAGRRPMSVVVLDLDHFKRINDRHGHAEGDRALHEAAACLREAVRADDVLGRLGGEEFLLLLPGLTGALAFAAAERARLAFGHVAIGGEPLRCSAGVATFPEDGTAGPELLEHADAALEAAKRAGRNQTRRYRTAASGPLAPRELGVQIKRFLDSGSGALHAVYQPILELATGRIAGYEALARFDAEPPRAPNLWFADAHRVGLGTELEARAVTAALAMGRPPNGAFLAINVSPQSLTSEPVLAALPDDLTGIILELTEHEQFESNARLDTLLAQLRAREARIALDDAGAGYAGLQQLIRFAPDLLKLDRSLVDGAHDDPSRVALLEALVAFAHATGAAVCAEGVEHLADLRMLADLDVTYAQGFRLARPGAPWADVASEVGASVAAEVQAGARVAGRPSTAAGAWSRDLADLAEELAGVTHQDELATVGTQAAQILNADDTSLFTVVDGQMQLLTAHEDAPPGMRWRIAEFPATAAVLASGTPAQVIVGDAAADPAEVADLRDFGMAALLMVPIPLLRGEQAMLEVYRRRPQAFSAAEIDRARIVAMQFIPVLANLRSAMG
jgi:diguanylate cyclase (GGDEF)-like protein